MTIVIVLLGWIAATLLTAAAYVAWRRGLPQGDLP